MTAIDFPEELGLQALASVATHVEQSLVSAWKQDLRARGLDPTNEIMLAKDLTAAWSVVIGESDICEPSALASLSAWLAMLRTGQLQMFEAPKTFFASCESNWIDDIDWYRHTLTIRGHCRHPVFVLPADVEEFWDDATARAASEAYSRPEVGAAVAKLQGIMCQAENASALPKPGHAAALTDASIALQAQSYQRRVHGVVYLLWGKGLIKVGQSFEGIARVVGKELGESHSQRQTVIYAREKVLELEKDVAYQRPKKQMRSKKAR